MKRKMIFLTLMLLVWSAASVNAQVNIGSSDDPHGGAVLDLSQVSDKNLGLLLPKVHLETDVSTWNLDGEADSGAGMIIFNTNPDISGGKGIGLYVWNGSTWNALKASSMENVTSATGFTVSPAPISISVGSTQYIRVLSDSWEPEETTYKGVTWSVENGSDHVTIVSQDFYGCTILSASVGAATVRATSIDGNQYRDCLVTVKGCASPAQPGIILFSSGESCIGGTFVASIDEVAGATSYTWTVLGTGFSAVTSSTTNSIEIRTATAGTISCEGISVTANNDCSSSSPVFGTGNMAVVSALAQPEAIRFNTNESCKGGSFTASVTEVPGATSYEWTVSGTGLSAVASSTTNSIEIQTGTVGTSISRTGIAVRAVNSCGNSTVRYGTGTVSVSSVPTQPATITFSSTTSCEGGSFTASVAAVTGATSYTWTITGNGLSAVKESTTNSVQIRTATPGTVPRTGISVTANNSCGNSTSVSGTGNVTVTALPGQIGEITFSADMVCVNGTFTASVEEVPNATSYVWTVTGDGLSKSASSTTRTLTIKAANLGTISREGISVIARNSCMDTEPSVGTGSVTVITKPAQPSAIRFDKDVTCIDGTFTASVDEVPDATSYTWTISGTGLSAVAASTTNSIEIKTATAGTAISRTGIKVTANNMCGSSSQTAGTDTMQVIGAPAQPGTITFSKTLPYTWQLGETFTASIEPVNTADSYIWTIPTDYMEIQGDATGTTVTLKAIAVTLDDGIAASGIKVQAYDYDCGATGTARAGSGTLWIGDCANTTDDDLLGQLKMKDVDGNVYTVRPFGPQCWMTQNLRVSRGPNEEDLNSAATVRLNPGFYNKKSNAHVKVSHNGSEIVYSPSTNSGTGANYTENDVVFTNQSWDDFADKYGFMYERGDTALVCPIGWHTPTSSEYSTLLKSVGGDKKRLYDANSSKPSDSTRGGSKGYEIDDPLHSGFNLPAAGFINGTYCFSFGYAHEMWGKTIMGDWVDPYSVVDSQSFTHIPLRCLH